MVKKTPQKIVKKVVKKADKKVAAYKARGIAAWLPAPRQASTLNDIKNAVLLVSLTINVAIFIGWLALRVTTVYDTQVYDLLFNR